MQLRFGKRPLYTGYDDLVIENEEQAENAQGKDMNNDSLPSLEHVQLCHERVPKIPVGQERYNTL